MITYVDGSMRSFRSYGFSISGEHTSYEIISRGWSRRVEESVYERQNVQWMKVGRNRISQFSDRNSDMLDEKYNKFDVQSWTKENDTSRN